jgi:hypothetical protein
MKQETMKQETILHSLANLASIPRYKDGISGIISHAYQFNNFSQPSNQHL